MAGEAQKMFDELEELGCPRSVKSFNALLTAFTECGAFERVTEAFEKAVEAPPRSFVPNAISYNILFKALCGKGDIDAALKVLDLMKEKGFSPCLISYNTLLNAFYGKNQFSDGEKIWERMEEEKIIPYTKSFNAKLRGLVSEGRTSEVVKLVDELYLIQKPKSLLES